MTTAAIVRVNCSLFDHSLGIRPRQLSSHITYLLKKYKYKCTVPKDTAVVVFTYVIFVGLAGRTLHGRLCTQFHIVIRYTCVHCTTASTHSRAYDHKLHINIIIYIRYIYVCVCGKTMYVQSSRSLAGLNHHHRLVRSVPEWSRRFITEREATLMAHASPIPTPATPMFGSDRGLLLPHPELPFVTNIYVHVCVCAYIYLCTLFTSIVR